MEDPYLFDALSAENLNIDKVVAMFLPQDEEQIPSYRLTELHKTTVLSSSGSVTFTPSNSWQCSTGAAYTKTYETSSAMKGRSEAVRQALLLLFRVSTKLFNIYLDSVWR